MAAQAQAAEQVLEHRRVDGVAHETVGAMHGLRVERARGRDAEPGEAVAAAVLHQGLQSGSLEFNSCLRLMALGLSRTLL